MSLQIPFGGREVLEDALSTWGDEAQNNMAIEEFLEGALALVRIWRGRATQEEIVSELADVFIMVNQMAIQNGESLVQEQINFKLNRLEKRLGLYKHPIQAEGVKPV